MAPDPLTTANRLLGSGDYAEAALAYVTVASTAGEYQEPQLLAQAVLAYQDADDNAAADALLSRLDNEGTPPSAVINLAKACSRLAGGFFEDAFLLANKIDPVPLSPYQRGRHARCLGAAALQTNHIDDAATAWVSAYRYPYPEAQSAAIADATWRAVSRLPEHQAAALASSTDGAVSGWYALALLAKRAMFDPAKFAEGTAGWEVEFPYHPARALIETLTEQSAALAVRPRKIALLLPFDDTLAGAASAIRDGFITAWYMDSQSKSRPDLQIYSSAAEKIEDTVSRAVAEGAEFIVGPLRKSQVEILREYDEQPVKVLALNVGDQPGAEPRPGFYQFALTPEDEAGEVAQRAIRSGKRALLMAPDSAWGKRLGAAYARSWKELGGTVVGEVYFGEDSQAYTQAVKRSLNLDLSEVRSAELRRTVSLPLHFQPRRRADVDVILLAAFPINARQIMPLLRYHRAESIPVFATSHVFNGLASSSPDSDLDGISFGDMPWLFGGVDRESFNLIRRTWKGEFAAYGRLYAFGIDAYRLLPHLARMRTQHGLRLPGVTGDLWMDHLSVVHRNLSWSRFTGGFPKSAD